MPTSVRNRRQILKSSQVWVSAYTVCSVILNREQCGSSPDCTDVWFGALELLCEPNFYVFLY